MKRPEVDAQITTKRATCAVSIATEESCESWK